jgi:hypothetical protein
MHNLSLRELLGNELQCLAESFVCETLRGSEAESERQPQPHGIQRVAVERDLAAVSTSHTQSRNIAALVTQPLKQPLARRDASWSSHPCKARCRSEDHG